MININEVTGEHTQKRNPCWPQIPDHSYEYYYLEVAYQEKRMHYLI